MVKENVHQAKVRERAEAETKSLRQFQIDKSVWLEQPGLNTKLSEARSGPFTLTSHHSNVIYEIGWDQEGKKKERIVHVNNLKQHIYDEVSDDFAMVQRVVVVFEEIEEEKSQSSPVLTAEQQQSLDVILGNLAHPVVKKDGSLRICVDYRRLNSVTIQEPFHMPLIDEVWVKLGNI